MDTTFLSVSVDINISLSFLICFIHERLDTVKKIHEENLGFPKKDLWCTDVDFLNSTNSNERLTTTNIEGRSDTHKLAKQINKYQK